MNLAKVNLQAHDVETNLELKVLRKTDTLSQRMLYLMLNIFLEYVLS